MHTIILLSGKQGVGKSTLCRLLRNAKEIEIGNKLFYDLNEDIKSEMSYYETIIATSNAVSKVQVRHIEKHLKEFAEKYKINFLKYNL